MSALGPILAVLIILASVAAAIWWDESTHRRRQRRERDALDLASMRAHQQLGAGITRRTR
jgi:Flp pilus assembly protein TadB